MNEQLKSAIQIVFPASFIHLLKTTRADMKGHGPRRAFESVGPSGEYLDASMLPLLQKRYPRALPYGYDAGSLLRRGLDRKRQISRLLRVSGARTLELACHDGMVSGLLARDGAKAIGIDLGIDHFDRRALELGAEAKSMDATRLTFSAGSFDCVFSYNAFEHFSDPEAVLAEAIRVTRPGGILFFSFGPLYRASYGLHAMHSITVPFCQYLWPRAVLDDYIRSHGLGRIEYETLNEWTVRQFRELFAQYQSWAETIEHREVPSIHGIELVNEHPSCFRGKVEAFEDLVVSITEIALRRTDVPAKHNWHRVATATAIENWQNVSFSECRSRLP
jgi:SAM-dependent methyltransferase